METAESGLKNEYPIINIDVPLLERSTKLSFELLLKNKPDEIPFSLLAFKISDTQSDISSEIKLLVDSLDQLVEIKQIVPPTTTQGLEVSEVESSFIDAAIRDLSKFGLHQDRQTLTENHWSDIEFVDIWDSIFLKRKGGSLIEIASNVQREYFKVMMGTRLFQLTKDIMSQHAPKVPWIKGKAAYICNPKNTSRENDGYRNTLVDGTHLLTVGVYVDEDLSKLKSSAEVNEYYSDNIVVAAHEVAHAVFDEKFGSINGELNTDKANLRRVLTEGVAIEYENLMGDILDNMVPVLPKTMNYGPLFRNDRIDNFKETSDHPKFRKHSDGQIMMYNLKSQLGILEKTHEEQIIIILDWLYKVDMEKAMNTFSSEKTYHLAINDPVNSLPMLQDAN